MVHHAGEHAGLRIQRLTETSGILQRTPGDLEEQPQLRVHHLRFARRDAEEFGVEAVDVRKQSGKVRPVILEPAKEERPVARNGSNSDAPLTQQVP